MLGLARELSPPEGEKPNDGSVLARNAASVRFAQLSGQPSTGDTPFFSAV